MVVVHQSHWLGEEGETQKQVTPGEVTCSFLTLRLLLLQSLNCSIIHLSPASASSGMVQNVSKVNCLCSNDSHQLSVALDAFLSVGKVAGSSWSPSVEHSLALCVAVKRLVQGYTNKGLMGLPRSGHKHRGLPATYHLSSPLCQFNPHNFSLPQTKSIFFFFFFFLKNFMCLLV